MKRLLLLLVLTVILSVPQLALSQVMADFETPSLGTQGFAKGWGDALTSVARVDDATYGGVLELSYNSAGGNSGAMKLSPLDLKWTDSKVGAYFLTFDVYIPADFPDDVILKVWGQTMEGGWQWVDYKWSNAGLEGGKPLNKGAWNTLDFPIVRTVERYPTFKPWNCQGGMEIWFNVAWTGTVLIDNVTIWGVEPKSVADFNDEGKGTQGFAKGWGDALTGVDRVENPTYGGVLELSYSSAGSSSGALKLSPIDFLWTATKEGAGFLTYDVYLPADFPDNVILKVWGQTMEGGWQWVDYKWSGAGVEGGAPVVKDAWNTLTFPVIRTVENYPNFNPRNSQGGIEIWFNVAWTGTILIDNVRLHTIEVGKKWIYADFEKQATGTNGFGNTGWNAAMTGILWAVDPSGRSAGVLQTDWNSALDAKAQFVNENLDLKWTATDTGATAMTFDVWVPPDMPIGTQIGFWASDKKSWSWTEVPYLVSDSVIVPGKWTTITYDVLAHSALDPIGVIRAGIQVFFADRNWTGSIYFDNFTFVGIEKPIGALASPPVAASVDTARYNYVYNHITWTDNVDNLSETYNVYMSLSPITDLSAQGVVRIGTRIPRGTQSWNHRPYSTNGVDQSFYYAVTAVSAENEETEMTNDNKVGPVTCTTSKTIKAVYDPNFVFVIDGSLSEFETNPDYVIVPEGAGVDNAGDWTPASTDLNYVAYFVTDGKFLYLGANVIDDDLALSGQGWEGDALELFISFYDIKEQAAWHDLGDIDQAGLADFRISFTSWGETQTGGSSAKTYPGMTYLILPNPTGYLIEAQMELDSLGAPGWTPEVGDMLPFRIDCNDKDEVLDGAGTGRTKQLNTGGVGNTENWKRPCTWAYLEFYSPTGVAENVPSLPLTTQLYGNYPNPFNPTTTMKYDLAKASHVSLVIYNTLGQKIKTLVDAAMPSGSHVAEWDGSTDSGITVTTGIYFYEFKADGYSRTNKMILMK